MISAISSVSSRVAQCVLDRFLRTFVQEHEDLMRMHEELLNRREKREKQRRESEKLSC